jgi:hypothetical protein
MSDAAVTLRGDCGALVVVPSGPEPIQQPGARCAQEPVASPPLPPGILPGPMPGFCAAGRGGAGLQGPSSHVATMLLGGASTRLANARRSATLVDTSDRHTVETVTI